MKNIVKITIGFLSIALAFTSCNNGESKSNSALSSNAAEKVYVAPGDHDEFYAFISGGFSGQLAVYGLPSGRLFKVENVDANPEITELTDNNFPLGNISCIEFGNSESEFKQVS